MTDRLDDMLERYGEVCNRTVAAKILGCCEQTVRNMIRDGRLDVACGGLMVDVRSIAAYIERPRQEDDMARKRRTGRKWAV